MSKTKDDKNKQPHSGSVAAVDNELMKWLHKFFHDGEAPEKLQVWQATGANRTVRDAKIMERDFKANEALNQEECVRLANEITALCQHDCNTVGRQSHYIVDVQDRHRMTEPVTRKIGPLFPKQTTLAKRNQNGAASEDDEDAETLPGVKPMTLQYLDRLIAMVERKDQALTAITGDLLLHQSRENAELNAEKRRLVEGYMQMFFGLQDALDRKVERDDRIEQNQVNRARDRLIADGMREGGRIIATLAPSLLRTFLPESALPPASPPPQSSRIQGTGAQPALDAPPDYGPSEERLLVERFLEIIKDHKTSDGQQSAEKLLGDWDPDQNGVPQPNPAKPGILTPNQVQLLLGVYHGWESPDRVDELDPDWKHENSITGEQMMAAASVLPQSAVLCITQLLGLRKDKHSAANQMKTTV